jgi:hypothetical protein
MKLLYLRFLGLASFLLLVCSTALQAQTGARSECFAFEKLPPEQRKTAEEMLLKALDGEALYTIVGGIKPMSSGFQTFQMQVSMPRVELAEAEITLRELNSKEAEELTPDEKRRLNQSKQAVERKQALDKIAQTRAIFERWQCGGDIFADVHHYAKVYEGKRFYDAVVFSRSRLREMLAAKADFFSRWGITSNSHPLDVLYAVEYNETGARFGGYGYLSGYPDYAVEFFVRASDEEEFSGKFVERSFQSLPTFAGEHRFVYAVPKNHVENELIKPCAPEPSQFSTSINAAAPNTSARGKKASSR